MLKKPDLDRFFQPQSIAVIGVPSEIPKKSWPGIYGCLLAYGYPGRLYPINPKAKEIAGNKAYPNLSSLPEPVDLVILSIPAEAVPEALRECARTGNRNVHIFTAGFKETGEPAGIRLQNDIKKIADDNDLQVIGPNCMGLYVPKSRIATWVKPPDAIGRVAFLSQSGGHAQDFTNYGASLGLGFSKVVSYGNALTLDAGDFLRYLAEDPDTDIIALYLEGVADGRRLLEIVREVNQFKPVVILKAGLTESGTRAVASHTGSMAGQTHIWDAFFKQSGAIPAQSLQEMANTVLALQHIVSVQGPGVAVLGVGGGVGVEAADACSRAGLSLPDLPESTQHKLRQFVAPAGNMIKNPVDAFVVLLDLRLLAKTLDIISSETCFDMIIISLHLDWIYDIDEGLHIQKLANFLATSARRELKGKPFAVCWRTTRLVPEIKEQGLLFEETLLKANVPVYRELAQTANALSSILKYHLLKKQLRN
ncbi:MAG: CoA-binding protein [bacterium]